MGKESVFDLPVHEMDALGAYHIYYEGVLVKKGDEIILQRVGHDEGQFKIAEEIPFLPPGQGEWDSGIDYEWLEQHIRQPVSLLYVYEEAVEPKIFTIFKITHSNGSTELKKFPESDEGKNQTPV